MEPTTLAIVDNSNTSRKRKFFASPDDLNDVKKIKLDNDNNLIDAQMLTYDFGLFMEIDCNLDLNQCHLWTEHEVAEWIRCVPDWGNYYASKIIENGIDGRILLEYKDLNVVMEEADIQSMHKATFIYGVNMLRKIRQNSIKRAKEQNN